MSTLSIRIPDSIRIRLEHFADMEGVSVHEFVAAVLSQRVAVAEADAYVRGRAARGSAERLVELLDRAPNVEPESPDKIEPSGEQGGAGNDAPYPA